MSVQDDPASDTSLPDQPDRRRIVAGGAAGTLAYLMGLGNSRAQVGVDSYIGSIMLVGFNFAPKGWAYCDGSLLSIAQNTALFSLLGTNFGGNGQTTFALPDLRGRAPIGFSANFPIGAKYGTESVSMNASQAPAHSHGLSIGTSAPTGRTRAAPAGNMLTKTNIPAATMYGAPTDLVTLTAGNLAQTGGGQPHANIQPFLAMTYVIALVGIFPSRN